MKNPYLILPVVVLATALTLSWLWHVPCIFTLIGFAAWILFGHLITADDDTPGGWSNPDGSVPFPWGELVAKAIVFLLLCGAAAFPSVRSVGGAP